MARIPEAELERLKREVSLERLAEARGVKLKRHGADLIGLCPFHEDHDPSLVISPAKNLWHCLGACQAGGSVVDWVMKAHGVSFRHAVELLREDLPPLESATPSKRGRQQGPVAKHSTVTKLPKLLERDSEDDAVLRQVVDFYHQTLLENPAALEYLEKRGLRSSEMVERFRLGFADRTLGYRIPFKAYKEGAELRGRLQRLGVLRESGHEHFRGSVVVPMFDEEGRVTEMYGRKITPNLRAGTPLHTYLPGPHRGVWNIAALEVSKEIVLCEALFDALTFWCAGIGNVTSSYGVEGFTEDHWAALRRYGTRRVLIAYDRDDAGDRAAERLSQELTKEGIESYRVLFPKGMDANEYGLKVAPAKRSLELVVRQAERMAGSPRLSSTAALHLETAEPPEAAKAAKEEMAAESAAVVTEAPTEMPSEEMPTEGLLPLAVESTESSSAPAMTTAETAASVLTEKKGEDVVIRLGDRRWRIRGLGKNLSYEQLRVNVQVSREPHGFYVDTLELYSARQRGHFVEQAAPEIGLEPRLVKKDLGQVLLQLEGMQEAEIKKTLEPKEKAPEMTEGDRAAALELLSDPKLLDRILQDFERCGVVGEETNKLVGYLAAVSRKLDAPLAVVIQSSSAAGKSSLMDAVLALMPEEERVQYSAMTGQSLFYMGDQDLRHKILAIVEEEGAERASYALKILQSEGELTIASTGKDPATGRLVTHEYRVEGPVMIFLTTTAIEIDEELLNRCLVLTVDEGREQTRAIHRRQRESQTLEGLLMGQDREHVVRVHRNAQRMLRPLLVANPYAKELTFLDHKTRTRRDHMKYLTLIRAIALLHQHQRPLKTAEHRGQTVHYIEVTREDIAVANRLAGEVLGRSLDELPPQTRRLLGLVVELVAEQAKRLGFDASDVRFTRRDVREWTGWGNTQLKVHLGRLEELEYLLVHRGGRGQSFVFELLFDGGGENAASSGVDVDASDGGHRYDGNRSGQNSGWSGGGRAPVGPRSGGGRSIENAQNAEKTSLSDDAGRKTDETATVRSVASHTSYRHAANGSAPPIIASVIEGH